MTTAKEKYEAARARQKAAQQAVFKAIDANEAAEIIAVLKHELAEASKERRRAFEDFMNEI